MKMGPRVAGPDLGREDGRVWAERGAARNKREEHHQIGDPLGAREKKKGAVDGEGGGEVGADEEERGEEHWQRGLRNRLEKREREEFRTGLDPDLKYYPTTFPSNDVAQSSPFLPNEPSRLKEGYACLHLVTA